jgi:hypothetical protein
MNLFEPIEIHQYEVHIDCYNILLKDHTAEYNTQKMYRNIEYFVK